MQLQYLETLKQVGSSPSSKLVVPMGAGGLLNGLRNLLPQAGQPPGDQAVANDGPRAWTDRRLKMGRRRERADKPNDGELKVGVTEVSLLAPSKDDELGVSDPKSDSMRLRNGLEGRGHEDQVLRRLLAACRFPR